MALQLNKLGFQKMRTLSNVFFYIIPPLKNKWPIHSFKQNEIPLTGIVLKRFLKVHVVNAISLFLSHFPLKTAVLLLNEQTRNSFV